MKTVLLSGFEPFGDDTINPSLEAVKLLDKEEFKGGEIHIVQTPVVKQKSIDTVVEAIKKLNPDIVITIGQAGGRFGITPERVAINIDDYRIPDNDGNTIIDKPIVKGAPNAYFSTLPIKAMVKAMRENGYPALVSNSAGTFVCNHLFFGVEHFIQSNKLPIKHGFVHIPLLQEQAKDGTKPTMSLRSITDGLHVMIQAILDNEEDIKESGGSIC